MGWNYRVIRHLDKQTGDSYFAIHEYYYGENGGIIGGGCTESPHAVISETTADLRTTLGWMLLALDKPVIDYDTNAELKEEMP